MVKDNVGTADLANLIGRYCPALIYLNEFTIKSGAAQELDLNFTCIGIIVAILIKGILAIGDDARNGRITGDVDSGT